MEQISEPDNVLIEGCVRNDRRMQEKLYRKYSMLMYNICLAYAGDRTEAMDLLQEGFIKVFKNISKFVETGSLEGWIRRIVTNTAIDHYRKNQISRKMITLEEAEISGKSLDKTPDLLNYKDIYKQVKRLPNGARMIFNLHAIEGYTHKEIAEKLNITEGTSKSQVNRARKLLAHWLAEYRQ